LVAVIIDGGATPRIWNSSELSANHSRNAAGVFANWRHFFSVRTRDNTRVSSARERGENNTKEKAMVPMEGFASLGGHAVAVSRVARSVTEETERWGTSPQEALRVVVPVSRRDQILSWAGDLFLATGAWLKSRSVLASYQQA
jgi:hypothetical protein